MALPCGTTGSLYPTFVPDRPVCLTVKLASAIALHCRLPSGMSKPWETSVTLSEVTTPVKLPTKQGPPSRELEHQSIKGGISRSIPRCLATPLLNLPPILHMTDRYSLLSCSKGARGLFVPWRVSGIFTATTISPNSWLRQCPDRYTIRAGRNLPDKEFRYLRTVIVTAAVYWGFSSNLRSCELSSPLNLPAPGRCQTLCVNFHFGRVLCFW